MSWILKKKDLISAIKGEILTDSFDGDLLGVCTDSRVQQENRIFVALKGKNFDAHDFLQESFENGAKVFIVSDRKKAELLLKNKTITVFKVQDTTKALQELAIFWKQKLQFKVLAITGSNGKTTTKNFLQNLLSDLSVCSNPKSYNNHWGVPLSMLSVSKKDSILIQEIGTNSAGEISELTKMCSPFASTVTTVGLSHLEKLGSIENIAKEKEQIYSNSLNAKWIFNRDNLYTEQMFQKLKDSKNKIITCSKEKKDVNVHLSFVKQGAESSTIQGAIDSKSFTAEVSFFGEHNLENLMCACGLALSAGLTPEQIVSKISSCKTPSGRQELVHTLDKKSLILFDAYNANPTSMKSFFESCKMHSTKKMAFVLGDMKELGQSSKKHHQDLANYPVLQEASFVWFVGEHADDLEAALKQKDFKGNFFKTKSYKQEHLESLKNLLKDACFLGIKASRSLQLEDLFFDLTGTQIFDKKN